MWPTTSDHFGNAGPRLLDPIHEKIVNAWNYHNFNQTNMKDDAKLNALINYNK